LFHGVFAVPAGSFAQLNQAAKAGTDQELGRVQAQQSDVNAAAAENSTDGFRFYNQNTARTCLTQHRFRRGRTNEDEAFRVTSLPDVPFSLGEFYSGLMPITSGDTSRELFFIFQPTIGAPVDELTIWLNGGPGCSSLEGFFEENGLFVWTPGSPAPAINPYSWVNMTNMLWYDLPRS
jgi:Serine carboxypeptidase